MKNNKPKLYTASKRIESKGKIAVRYPPDPGYYHPRKLSYADMGPWSVKLSPKQAAELRRRQLDAIADRHEGYILAGHTYRRAVLHRLSAPGIRRRAIERAAILDELESNLTRK